MKWNSYAVTACGNYVVWSREDEYGDTIYNVLRLGKVPKSFGGYYSLTQMLDIKGLSI